MMLPSLSFGASNRDLSAHIDSVVTKANQAFNQDCEEQATAGTFRGDSIEFRQFFLGIAPNVSIGLSGVLNLQISPEITFIWAKTTPPASLAPAINNAL